MSKNTIHEKDERFENFKQNFETFGETKVAWLAGLLQGEAYFIVDEHNTTRESISPDYKPAPGTPSIKLAMIEQDLMEHVGQIFSKPVITENRKTTAKDPKTVYKVTLSARNEVEYVLKRIQPYIVGHKTRTKVEELLNVCNEYNQWLAEGWKKKAAQVANQKSQESKRARKAAEDQEII
jgi:hypothetical protein